MKLIKSYVYISYDGFPNFESHQKYCSRCNETYNDFYKFCYECGDKLQTVNYTVDTGYKRSEMFIDTLVELDEESEYIINSNISSCGIYILKNIKIADNRENIYDILDLDTSFDEELFKPLIKYLEENKIKYKKGFGIIK